MSRPEIREIKGDEKLNFFIGALLESILNNKNNDNEQDHECDCDNCENQELCNEMKSATKEDSESHEGPSFLEFLETIVKDINDKETDSLPTYNFIEMVDEFDNGFDGTFISEEGDIIKYDIDSKTILIVTEDAVFPASIDSHFVNLEFEKREVKVDNAKALEMAINGSKVYFTVDMFGTEVKGYITSKEGVPGFSISETMPEIRPETIVLMALFNGTWTLK